MVLMADIDIDIEKTTRVTERNRKKPKTR